jgi:hypothetical protein
MWFDFRQIKISLLESKGREREKRGAKEGSNTLLII